MENQITTSKQFTIDWRDISKGILIAILTPVLFVVQQSLTVGELTFNWKSIGVAAISGGIAYIIKNFLSPSEVKIKVSAETADLLDQKIN